MRYPDQATHQDQPINPVVLQSNAEEKVIQVPTLSAQEITDAEFTFIRQLQAEAFHDKCISLPQTKPAEIKKTGRLAYLRPYWDTEKQVIRVNSRIELHYKDF